MKRIIVCLTAVAATLAFIGTAQAQEGWRKPMNINIWANGIGSVSGDFSQGLKTRDVVENGPGFAIAWQYYPLRFLGVQAGYQLSWMRFEKEYRTVPGQTPDFVVQQITLSGIYNFENFIGANRRVQPLVTAGAGIYPFRFTQDGVTGDVLRLGNGNKFEKTALGLNAGAGVQVRLVKNLSVLGLAQYNYLFAKDNSKFGADSGFGNQQLLNVGVGLSYNIPVAH